MNNSSLHNALLTEIISLGANWHITFTHDTNHRTSDQHVFEQRIREYMTTFERVTLGRNWFRKYHRFIAIMERHADNTLHAHIVINSRGMGQSELETAFNKVAGKIKSGLNVFITPICDRTSEYILKQVKTNDSTAYLPSEYLFGINHHKKRHNAKGYQKYNIAVRNTISDTLFLTNWKFS